MDPERGTNSLPGSSEPKRAASFVSAGAYAGLGFQLLFALLLGLYAGKWLDRKIGTAPLFLIIGTFGGAAAGFFALYRKLMADQKENEKRQEDASRRD